MSVRLSMRIKPRERVEIASFAQGRSLSFTEAIRYLAVLGAGGSDTEATAVNRQMSGAYKEMIEALRRVKQEVVVRAVTKDTETAVVRVPDRAIRAAAGRSSKTWATKIRKRGGLGCAARAGWHAVHGRVLGSPR